MSLIHHGGGGGSWTPVRKHFNGTFSGRRRLLRESSSLFPFQTANRHAVRSGKSHDAWAGQLFPASRTPHKRRLPRPVASPVQTAALIRQQQQQCCCYLIYNCPFYGGQAPPPAYPASIPPSKPVHPQIVASCISLSSATPASGLRRRKFAHFAAPPFQTTNASLVSGLISEIYGLDLEFC